MKKKTCTVLALCLVLALCSCGSPGKDTDGLILSTGTAAGTYNSLGVVMAKLIGEKAGIKVTPVLSAGSKANMEALRSGSTQLAFTQYDVMLYAYNGEKQFAAIGAYKDFSVVAALYPECVHIVALDPAIRSVEDLRGKTVSLGEQGSGVYFTALDILGAYGMSENDVAAEYHSFGESMKSLRNGKLDAAFIVAGAPVAAVSELSGSDNIRLISLDDEHVSILTAGSPAYSAADIGRSVYGTAEDCRTVAINAVLVTSRSIPEKDVTDILSAIYGNKTELVRANAVAANLTLELASSVEGVPYHPGAVKFFRANGITVPGA